MNLLIKILVTLRLSGIAKMMVDRLRISTLNKNLMLRFYSKFIHEGDLCFDVGANLGYRTEIFLRLGANILAIEPQEYCVRQLLKKYKNNDRVNIIQKALGEKEGEAEMMINSVHTLSSLSKEWIGSVTASGRFSAFRWDKVVLVPVTNLDKLIDKYGKPAFCKIDVEGFEFQVIKGLSQPINLISFEFTPEFIDSTLNSIKYLSNIGMSRFNYILGESMYFSLSNWVKAEEICGILESLPDKTVFGDVYAKSACI